MEHQEIKNYNSVGGWLSLLCILLIVVAPISNIIAMYTEVTLTSSYFGEVKGLQNYVYIEIFIVIIKIILSIWAGVSLLLIKPYAVLLTKFYLIFFLLSGILQRPLARLAGLETDFIKEMSYQFKVNFFSALMVFGIWYTYLIVSKRVRETYPKYGKQLITRPDRHNEENLNKFKFSSNSITDFYNNHLVKRLQKIKKTNLNSDEVIIISVILATIIGLILGYSFGETSYFTNNGSRTQRTYSSYSEFYFNYLAGLSSFIIVGGLTYIYLNRLSSKNE